MDLNNRKMTNPPQSPFLLTSIGKRNQSLPLAFNFFFIAISLINRNRKVDC